MRTLDRTSAEYSVSITPDWKNVETKIEMNLDTFYLFYRQREHRANSPTLIKLIKKIESRVDLNMTDYEISSYLTDIAESIFMATDIVSESNHGKRVTNIVGNNTPVVMFGLTTLITSVTNWEEIIPLDIIWHFDTNTSLNQLIDQKPNKYIISSIDICKLAIQYKYWKLRRLSVGLGVNTELYIEQYLLTNSVVSYFNISLVNSFFKTATFKNENVFNQIDVSTHINRIYSDKTKFKRYSYGRLLANVPVLYSDVLTTLQKDPLVFPNRNQRWIRQLYKIPLYEMLLSSFDNTYNSNFKSDLGRELMLMKYRKDLEVSFLYKEKIIEYVMDSLLISIHNKGVDK